MDERRTGGRRSPTSAGCQADAGYVTEVFCEQSRYFHPDNGLRIDAIRDAIEERIGRARLYPVLLTSLLEAADRVDSTTGLQMAYLKQWAPRALSPSSCGRRLSPGPGRGGDAATPRHLVRRRSATFDFAYLDPPYNQHRYFANYHVWETLVRWDAPDHYGVACKRLDCRERLPPARSTAAATMPVALRVGVARCRRGSSLVSYNDESWLDPRRPGRHLRRRGHVEVLGSISPGATSAPRSASTTRRRRVGTVSHLRNTERLAVCGPEGAVAAAVEAWHRGLPQAPEARIPTGGASDAASAAMSPARFRLRPGSVGFLSGDATMRTSTVVLTLAVFGASAVEMVEALTIVVASA